MNRRRWSSRPAPSILLGLGLIQACSSGPEGERLADGQEPPEGAPIEVLDEPILSVGVVAGDSLQEFHDVVTPFLLPDGGIAVPLSDQGVIRVFNSTGAHERTLGGSGDGPGEFAWLTRAWARGDTIEGYDNRNRRVTRFLSDDTYRVVTLDRVPSASLAVPGTFGEGWVLMGIAGHDGDGREQMVGHRFGPEGEYLGELVRVPGLAWHDRMPRPSPEPFSPRAVFALRNDRLYLSDTSEPRVAIHDPDGGLVRELRWTTEPGPSASEAWPDVEEAILASYGSDPGPEALELVRALAPSGSMPAFWDFLVDDHGYVWIRAFDPEQHAALSPDAALAGPGTGGAWRILDPEGRVVGSVTIPDGLEPVEVTGTRLLGIHRDALGVEFVRVHGVERR